MNKVEKTRELKGVDKCDAPEVMDRIVESAQKNTYKTVKIPYMKTRQQCERDHKGDGKVEYEPSRQGDLYLHHIEKPESWDTDYIPYSGSQLAPGTSRGSSHRVEAGCMEFCEIKIHKDADALTGPVIWAKKPGLKVEHSDASDPERHGSHIFNMNDCFIAITYQKAFAEERKRVVD